MSLCPLLILKKPLDHYNVGIDSIIFDMMQPIIFHKRPNWDNREPERLIQTSSALQYQESVFQTVMARGKWCDKIIKANEDSWLHFFNPHQFSRAVITNQKNVSYAIHIPRPWLSWWRQRCLDCLTVCSQWCCSNIKKVDLSVNVECGLIFEWLE